MASTSFLENENTHYIELRQIAAHQFDQMSNDIRLLHALVKEAGRVAESDEFSRLVFDVSQYQMISLQIRNVYDCVNVIDHGEELIKRIEILAKDVMQNHNF